MSQNRTAEDRIAEPCDKFNQSMERGARNNEVIEELLKRALPVIGRSMNGIYIRLNEEHVIGHVRLSPGAYQIIPIKPDGTGHAE